MTESPCQAQSSIYPIGGQCGTNFESEVVEANLNAPFSVRFDCGKLKATARQEKGQDNASRIFVNFETDEKTAPGIYAFQLISAEGLSKRLTVQVNAEPNVKESDQSHQTPSEAQRIEYPVVVNGRIARDGEVDYYSFHAGEGEELLFELITASGLILENSTQPLFNTPMLTLHTASGSWFDPRRGIRIYPKDESVSYSLLDSQLELGSYNVLMPRLRKKFDKAGWYLLRISSIRDTGNLNLGYQLRVVPADRKLADSQAQWTPRRLVHDCARVWEERSFSSSIEPNWADELSSRTIRDQIPAENIAPLKKGSEKEPNDEEAHASAVEIGSIVEGTIDRPGDEDYFKFEVKKGERLAFEVRTPNRTPTMGTEPFKPWLALYADGNAEPFLANFYRRVVNGSPLWVKSLQPKTIYTFEKAGSYILRIRELTSRVGNKDYVYQLAIRRQIPHLGKIAAVTINKDGLLNCRNPLVGINLKAGKAEKISVMCEREEGYDGDVLYSFENLPPGVRALPANAVEPDVSAVGNVFEALGTWNKPCFQPQRNVSSILLTASDDAVTTNPSVTRLVARPIIGGRVGPAFQIQEIPVIVIK